MASGRLLLAARRPCVRRAAFPSHGIRRTSCAGLRRNAAPSAGGGGVCSGWRAVLNLALARVLCTKPSAGPRPKPLPCSRELARSRDVSAVRNTVLCVTGSPIRPARLGRAREDTLFHNVSLTRDSEVARAPRSTISPFRQSETQCMHARARGSPTSPKGTTFASLPHSPARTPPTSSGDRDTRSATRAKVCVRLAPAPVCA